MVRGRRARPRRGADGILNADISATKAARDLEDNPILRALARGGYAASGVVHVLIGILVLALAFGGRGDADQAGALRAIAGAPLGFVVLWIIAGLLIALAVYHLAEAFIVRGDSRWKTWGRRVSECGQAVVFAALGVVSAAVALGAKPDSDESAQGASRGVLALPGGPVLLGLIGLGIGIGGVAFVVMGIARSFDKKVDLPSGGVGRAVTALGITGYVAKGVALTVVGILLLVAAVTADADVAGGLDAAFETLDGLFLGPLIVGVVGAGLIAYGVFLAFRARYARL